MRNRFLSLLLRRRRALASGLLLAASCVWGARAAVLLSQRETSRDLPADTTATPTAPAATLEAALHALADQADVVFTGEVSSITQTPGFVEIRWQVEDAVRGAAAGQVYVLREWAGLWQADGTRYRTGQRALLLLHAPSSAGYASPVGGPDGVVALRGDAGSGTLDLRLLQRRVLVTEAAQLRPVTALKAAGGSLPLSDALQRASAARQAVPLAGRTVAALRAAQVRLQPESNGTVTPLVVGVPSEAAGSADSNSSVDAGMVVGMLRAWQRGGTAR